MSAKTPAVTPAANSTAAPIGSISSATAPAASSSIETPTRIASAPHRLARMPSRLTWRSTTGGLRDENAQLDAGREVVAGGNGKREARAVEDAGGHHDLQQVSQQLRTAPLTVAARPRPEFAAPAAVTAGAAYGHFERQRGSLAGLAAGQLQRRAERSGALFRQERATDAIDCRRD